MPDPPIRPEDTSLARVLSKVGLTIQIQLCPAGMSASSWKLIAAELASISPPHEVTIFKIRTI